ncbi:MAG: hypothetical protein CL484_01045 [Acidobacteria bacterium]|nr:hypothetical protein [Acidobacteriota bacterium]|tara:strand:- start:551 stop:1246 length:696 start_codon:yes stop_codon:yes gene_type:complete
MVKTTVGYLIATLVLMCLAFASLMLSQLERRIADADRDLATLNFIRATERYDAIASTLATTDRLPWLLPKTRNTVSLRQASVRYWTGDYDPIVAHYASPDSPNISNNPELQFVVANANYLSARRPDDSRQDLTLGALDHAIGVYRRFLETNDNHLEAAFNYELMVRLRKQIAEGDVPPPFHRPTAPGNEGEEPEEAEMEDVQIYVPRDRLVDPEDTNDPTIGAGATIRKRG